MCFCCTITVFMRNFILCLKTCHPLNIINNMSKINKWEGNTKIYLEILDSEFEREGCDKTLIQHSQVFKYPRTGIQKSQDFPFHQRAKYKEFQCAWVLLLEIRFKVYGFIWSNMERIRFLCKCYFMGSSTHLPHPWPLSIFHISSGSNACRSQRLGKPLPFTTSPTASPQNTKDVLSSSFIWSPSKAAVSDLCTIPCVFISLVECLTLWGHHGL